MVSFFHRLNLIKAPASGFLLAVALMLQGCVGAAVGAGAAVGVSAYDERGVMGVANDLKIATLIHGKLIDKKPELAVKVGIEVHQGRVLMTGILTSEDLRADVVGMAWKTEGVKEVYNEILITGITGSVGVLDMARDVWITTKLRSVMTFDEEILAINYAVETVNGTVYLLGLAQNQAELNRVIAHARAIEYVRKIISHVRLKKAASSSLRLKKAAS